MDLGTAYPTLKLIIEGLICGELTNVVITYCTVKLSHTLP